MRIKFFGVRGSYPVPGPNTVKYGGNTTCVTVYQEDERGNVKNRIIIDSGTGIIGLGKEMLGNFFSKKESLGPPINVDGTFHMEDSPGPSVTVLFTHLHPDHTQGFPFAAFNYIPACRVKLYGMCALKQHVEGVLEQQQMPPCFPLEYRDLKSTREHHILKDGSEVFVGGVTHLTNGGFTDSGLVVKVMQAYAPSHPQQGALYYRITEYEKGVPGKSVACIWDNESHIGGDRAVIKFAKDCDVMIHDTQYTAEEYHGDKPVVQGFGHSTYDMAMDNAQQAGVPRLICLHYNPAHTDEFLAKLPQGNVALQPPLHVTLAQEGMVVDV
jgi:ribonuclease BN (tRNA processing enzyme)